MDILFLSRTIPDEFDAEVRSKMINTMDDAAIAWQKHIIDGLDQVNSSPVKIFNFLPVRSWPGGYKEAFIKKTIYSHSGITDDINLPFCNIQFIKRLVQGIDLYKEVKVWAKKESKEEKIIISYSLYPEFLKAVKIAKKYNPNIKSCAIVLDLPEFSILSKKINFFSKVYLRWHKRQSIKLLSSIDSFSLLTKQMKDALNIEKPFCVTEGICSKEIVDVKKTDFSEKIIFYAGTLHARFGILHLLKSFSRLEDEKYRLVICGYGDSKSEIINASKQDSRIIFKGQLDRKEVLKEMAKADVIVNPRQDFEDFTKYSFPSKNIEALSTGIPFVGYKLPGIPDEYDEFINYPTDNSEIALSQLLNSILTDKTRKFINKALNGKKWVFKEKNEIQQAKKIINVIKGGL